MLDDAVVEASHRAFGWLSASAQVRCHVDSLFIEPAVLALGLEGCSNWLSIGAQIDGQIELCRSCEENAKSLFDANECR